MEKKFVFQGVHMLFSGGFNSGIASWKAGEKRECRFVFIGRNLDKKALEEGFMDCKAKEKMRFSVGDEVFANVGVFKKGRVVRVWDEGNPYRVELEDGSNVWVPVDSDTYVRDKFGNRS
jgi:hypothetical protein